VCDEGQASDYHDLLGEYVKDQEELAELRQKLKRIGQNFVSLGTSLMMHPAATALDNPSFLADTVNLWDILERYNELTRELAERKRQLSLLKPHC